jgi:ATP-dependent helicase/nuclease subunit B
VRRQLLVPFGPEATECLVELVREAKAGEPLAPVTVAVPGSYAGLALRRALAAHPTTTATPGLVNVRFLALARVAELLGAPTLAIDARPLTDALRADAVRRVLADGVGALGGRARHPQTERSVEASLAELRRADPATIARLAKVEPAGRRAVELLRAYESATAGTYDDEDLQLSGARAAREQPGRLRETGPVIVHLPRELSAAEQELLDAIATASGVAVIHGLTGEEEADASTLGLADRLEDLLGPAVRWVPAGDAPDAEPRKARVTRFLAAPDPDEEVRAALRRVLAGPAERPLHRVALVYRDPDPYARIAHEQLEAAGVPASGASTRALADTVTGRVLLSLLALADDEFRRDTVVAWMSTAPILEAAGSGRWIPADRWNQISRDAGVIRGLEQWSERLDHHRELREAARARWSDDPEWVDPLVDLTVRLRTFVAELGDRTVTTRPGGTGGRAPWSEWTGWAVDLLDRYLGREGLRAAWPDVEIEAAQSVRARLDGLRVLDTVSGSTDQATFRRALERELESGTNSHGKYGTGIFVGSLRDCLAAGFDEIHVLGMIDGAFPPRAREDPLLPDDVRAQAGPDLAQSARHRAEERREFLAVLAAAPEITLSFPMADLRAQQPRMPARWLVELAAQAAGEPITAAELTQPARLAGLTVIPSFAAGVRETGEAVGADDADLRALDAATRAGAAPGAHPIIAAHPARLRAYEQEAALRTFALTTWYGRVGSLDSFLGRERRPLSPTSLERYAQCPFKYLLESVLRVQEYERPEESDTITPRDRGSLMHGILERFIRDARPRRDPADAWDAADAEFLETVMREEFAEAEAMGRTGQRLLWELEQRRIRRTLTRFLTVDSLRRRADDSLPQRVELAFGMGAEESQPAIAIPIGDGRALELRGLIDRVDISSDGKVVSVYDYKSGRQSHLRKLTGEDPVLHGTTLQLPIYAQAALEATGAETARVAYWLLDADHKQFGYEVGPEQVEALHTAVATIAAGIEDGLFPPRPGPPRQETFANCRFCAYDRVCSPDRDRIWVQAAHDVELRPYLTLTGELPDPAADAPAPADVPVPMSVPMSVPEEPA